VLPASAVAGMPSRAVPAAILVQRRISARARVEIAAAGRGGGDPLQPVVGQAAGNEHEGGSLGQRVMLQASQQRVRQRAGRERAAVRVPVGDRV
jgi:hypothetical protein